MEDNKFLISIKVAAYNTQKIPIYYLDLQTQDIAFIAYCSQEAGNKNSNAKALQLKQAIDIEKAETLKFIDYVKDIRIDSYSIAMGNTFTNVSLQGTDAPCPQYMGGQDIDIIVQLTTSNAAAVALLDDLPRKSAYLNRTYQSILPMFPVKIDSEFTRMIGVTEVSFDNIVINTIPNHPGLYSIQITMKSADRTLRNREALVKVSIENNEHITNVSVSAKEKAQTYFDLNKTISQVDLYPDLELPTVENLGKHGFQFIRYKNRILKYPDPDFYFIYPGMIMNEAVRESIMKYLGKLADVENDTVYLDKFGAKLTLDGYGHIDPSSTNNAFKKQLEKYKITETDRIKQDNIRAKEQSKALGAAIVSDLGSWDICNSIKVVFMESYYLRQLQLYQENKEQGNKDSQKVKNGADVYNKLSPIRDRVSQINEFLKTEPVADDENTLRTLKDMISFTTDTIDEEPLSATITKTDGTQNYKKMIDNNTIIERIIIAALAGKAGRMEYQDYKLGSNKDHTVIGSVASLFSDEYKKTWLPDSTLYGVIPSDNQADSIGVKKITEKIYIDSVTTKSDTDLFNSMTEVGMFRIHFYTKKELEKIIAPETLDTEQLAIKDQYGYNIGDAVFTLDPYYRYASPQTIRDLKYKLMYSKSLGYIMFLRETLYWLKYMYEHNILPSISMDILRKDAENEYKILKDLQRQESELQKDTISESTEKDTNNKSTGKNKEVKLSEFQRKTAKAISTFMKKSGAALDYGKLFAALSLAITNGNKGLRLAMIQRNYNSLNAYVKSSMHPNTNIENADLDKGKFRKFILALVGEDIISEPKDIGKSPATPAQQFFSGYNQRKVLEAANDPSQWIFHSFYDMIRSDFRGRMVRAFPTFYMIMIDEGRNLGFWKLHDNFYNTNAITEIKIMKSRKIAADTAMVTMSNMFNTFTDQDEDGKYNYKYNFSDVFDSVFSPITYARTEEIRRKLTPEINRAKIRAGVRIHIRLGYGSDASLLPVGFNGVITEIQEGPVVQFLAQGDGIELSSPLMDVTESDYIDDIMCRDKLLGTFRENTGGQTPKTILDTLLTQRGDWLAKQVKDWEISRYFNENPYGIYHFGDMDYKDIIDTGEPTQNIYEVDKNPSWGDIVSDVTITTDTNTDKDKNDLNTIRNSSFTETSASAPNEWPPQISFTVANKSIWDIMNICASTSPEFISAIVPFGFRSSIFLGRPKYYYAYDYKQVNSGIIECRKPFSQYHMYYDTCDIIQNSVTASKKQLRTVVTGLYKRTVWPTITNCKVGPLHADFEIYPENQRSIMYDTQYIARNPWANGGFETNASKRQHDKEGDSSKESILGSGSSWSLNSLNPFGSTWQMLYNELIPDKAKNDEMSHIAWRMCAHKLKDCMKEMYQGQLLIIGDPSVKPYDRMFINDMYRDMNGSCLVRDVTHMFSVKNGFTTAITPDCISTVDDRDEYIVQSTTAKLTYTITRTLIIWGVYQLTVAKYAAMGGKTLKAAGSEIDKFLKNYKAYQTLIKGKDAVKGTPAKIVSSWKNLTKEYQLIQDIGVNIGRGVKFGSKLALRFAPLYAIYVATSCALAMFSNATKNLRVLKVFPLQHHGIPYTAGLDGNMNLVYGSPSDNQEGLIGELIGKIVAPEKGGDPNSEALNMFRELFFDEDTLNTASKFKHESGITDADGNPVCTEAQLSDLMKGMYKDSPMYYKGSSVELLKTPRCAMNDKREVTRSCADFRIGTIADFSYDSNISKSILLNTHPKLQNYFNSGFLRSVYTGQEFSDYDRLKQYNIRVGKQIESINGITEADNSKIVTIPFLNDDAVVVLNDIIRYSYDIVHGKVITNPNDTESCRKEMEPHYIVIKKAMSVGSSDLYSSSGFSFIIQGYGDILKDQLADIVKIVDDNATKDNQHLFMYNIYDDGEIGIAIALPKR
jgi:hypothetical protein